MFRQTRFWQRFCTKKCKNEFYKREAQEGRDLLRKTKSLDLKDRPFNLDTILSEIDTRGPKIEDL